MVRGCWGYLLEKYKIAFWLNNGNSPGRLTEEGKSETSFEKKNPMIVLNFWID